MLTLFLLPGRLIAEIGYLFPGKGQFWAAARRRENRLAHAIFAVPFWYFAGPPLAAIVIGVFAALLQSAGVPLRHSQPADQLRAADPADRTIAAADAPQAAVYQEHKALPIARERAEPDPDPNNNATPSPPPSATQQLRDQIAEDPGSIDEIEVAMRDALREARPVRWKSGKLKGYAVPSIEAVGGCRTIQVSVDHEPNIGIAPVQRCDGDR